MRAITPAALRDEIAERILRLRETGRRSVLIDAAPTAAPEQFAVELEDPLRVRGLPVQLIAAADFWLPASLRLEQGHHDPDSYYQRWLDEPGLYREVFHRWRRSGPCSILPSLWDPVSDRATRAAYREQAENAVLILAGSLLLHRGFPVDLSVHLGTEERTVRRELSAEDTWILPAIERYRAEASPETRADIFVRFDHPERPAVDGTTPAR